MKSISFADVLQYSGMDCKSKHQVTKVTEVCRDKGPAAAPHVEKAVKGSIVGQPEGIVSCCDYS